MTQSATSERSNLAFLQGGGEMAVRMREFDWARHPLGDPASWPQSLKSAVSICLGSRFPILLWWGPDLFMLYNDAYRPMLGTTKHPAALGQAGKVCWPEIWDIIGPMLEGTVLRDGEATWSNDQLLLLERNGFVEECYFTFTYSPIRDESGGVGGVFCAVIETTERVVGERRLRLLRDLAAVGSDAIDAEDVCRRAMSVVDQSPGDLAFARVYLFDTDGAGRLVADTAAGPSHLPAWVSREEADTVRWPDSSLILPIEASGQPTATGLLVAGLNPQRPRDANYRAFLSLVAGQLGSLIADARALEAERSRAEALAQLDRAKTAFFSNVSHEFRTPLTLLLGPVQDALATPERSLDADALATVNRNALRLLKLVNTLLDFARIEAGRAEASYEPTDLAPFTADLAGAFRSAVESAGLQFDVDCSPLSEPVYVDRVMWEKIVFNLLSNALKFTFEGGIRLALSRDGDTVLLRVTDTGAGIAADQIPHVFERFHRVRGTRARTHEGAGIGLALVQELVRLHGGTVAVQSQVGKGTSFLVSVPLGTAHLTPESINAPRAPSSTSVGADAYVSEALGWLAGPGHGTLHPRLSRPGTARILLADDNADLRDYVARLLGERWGVDTVADGAAALDAVRKLRPDVVVADVMMPEMDGFELLAALQADPDTRDIPVVLLSARAGEEAMIEGIAAGAADYLVKPFTARDLLARVDAQVIRAQERKVVRDRMAQVESLVNNAPFGVYLVDQDFRIAHVNPPAAPIFSGMSDPVGRDFDDVIHRLWPKEAADEIVEVFRHTLDTGEPYVTADPVQYRVDRGVADNYQWRVIRTPLPDGRFGIVCYFRDVSAQRQAAAAKAYLAAIVDSAEDAIIAKDLDGIIQSCNAAAERLFGYSQDELVGRPVRILIPPDRQMEEDDILARLRRGERIEHFETVRVTKHGRLLDIALTISPVRDESGGIIGASKIARDITAIKRAEAERLRLLQEHAAVMETLNNVGSIVASDLDRTKVVQAVTDAATELTAADFGAFFYNLVGEAGESDQLYAISGVPPERLSGFPMPRNTDVFGPTFRGTSVVRSADVTKDSRYGHHAPYYGMSAGQLPVRSYLAVPVRGHSGDVIGGLFFGHSEAGRFDEHHERLAVGVASWASVALENARLYMSVHEASRIKDEFLASLSHELRTPLNAILGYARMLRSGIVAPDKKQKAIDTIERNATSLTQIVEDVLDISRIVSGKIRLNVQPVDFPDIVRSAIDAIAPAADAKGVRVETLVDPQAAPISGDPERLQQVLWNLLSNAVKFTNRDGKVQVRLECVDSHVEVTVADTGIGISPAFLPHVFERFRQGDAGISRERGGLGLGLAITRQLTELHGGTIEASSAGVGQGATFRIKIPLMIVHPASEGGPRVHPRSQVSARKAVLADLRGVRVLAVDDEQDALFLLSEVLEAAGAAVSTAQSAQEALTRLNAEVPDVVVADLGMPQLDGFGFIDRVRRHPNPRVRDLPAAALTAYARSEDRMKALRAGFQIHLAKPIDPAELVTTIASLAKRFVARSSEEVSGQPLD